MAIRRTGLLPRDQFVRDARLFVVATEGACDEPDYIDQLKRLLGLPTERLNVIVLPAESHDSWCEQVLARLIDFRRHHQTIDDDEFWLMVDLDKIHEAGEHVRIRLLKDAAAENVRVAFSNPCFEVWLLLHGDVSIDATRTCRQLKSDLGAAVKQIREAATGSPRRMELLCTWQRVQSAWHAAAAADPDRSADTPPAGSTHAHRLLESILRASPPGTPLRDQLVD